jgi:hypothetical protein
LKCVLFFYLYGLIRVGNPNPHPHPESANPYFFWVNNPHPNPSI